MANARKAAVSGLIKVENSGWSNLIVNSVLQEVGLDVQSRSFAVHLFYGTLERRYTLDALLKLFINKDISKLDIEVINILRSALYQIFYMDSVPTYVAVNEAVSLCRVFKKSSATGFVNTVLRKSTEHGLINEFNSEEERLHIQYSVNKPIVNMLLSQYKEDAEGILKSFFVPQKIIIRVNTLKITKDELINYFKKLQIEVEESKIENALVLYYKGDLTKLEPFQEGLFHVQGEASQWCIQAAEIVPNSTVIDLCAAPGGKTATIAQYMENTGTLICADKSTSRLKLAQTLLSRLAVSNVKFIINDATTFSEKIDAADTILCDVPCSGLGIIAKKPDIRFKNLEDIEELYETQRNILLTATKYVKIHGKLVYSTCTINKKENEDQIKWFLSKNENYEVVIPKYVMAEAEITKFGTVLLPNKTQTDGFFVAVMKRMW